MLLHWPNDQFFGGFRGDFHLNFVGFFGKFYKTRMHSSRMRTVHNSSRLLGGDAWSGGMPGLGGAWSRGCLLRGVLLGGWHPSMH